MKHKVRKKNGRYLQGGFALKLVSAVLVLLLALSGCAGTGNSGASDRQEERLESIQTLYRMKRETAMDLMKLRPSDRTERSTPAFGEGWALKEEYRIDGMKLTLFMVDNRVTAWDAVLFYDSREDAESAYGPLRERLTSRYGTKDGSYHTSEGLLIECGIMSGAEEASYSLEYKVYPVPEEESAQSDVILPTEDQVLEKATHIVDAFYMGENRTEYGTEYIFKTVKSLKGEMAPEDLERFYVTSSAEELSADGKPVAFEEGKEYILFLEKNISVYYEHNKYVRIGAPLEVPDDSLIDTLLERIADLPAGSVPAAYGTAYSTAEDLASLTESSSNIFAVRIEGVYAESTVGPTTVWSCRVTKTIKGTPAEGGNILITFFNGTVEEGGEYLVLLADATRTAPVYTLSSRNGSVYPLPAESEEVLKLLEQAADFETEEN